MPREWLVLTRTSANAIAAKVAIAVLNDMMIRGESDRHYVASAMFNASQKRF